VQIILVSGLSGAGKSIALDVLEDGGYYCVDNLPATLLMDVVQFLAAARVLNSVASAGFRAVPITCQPRAAYCRASSRPMPRFAPVTSTVGTYSIAAAVAELSAGWPTASEPAPRASTASRTVT
jgi:hypothetical protein